MFNDDDLKRRWEVYSKQRETAGDPLDGMPDFDLQLYVRSQDREDGCTILREDSLKEFIEWRDQNRDVVSKALGMIDTLRKDGKGHYSIRDLVGHFRHFEDVNQTDRKFRINDHVGPLLARHCIFLIPRLRDFFELRSSKKSLSKVQAIAEVLVDDADFNFTCEWDDKEWLEIGHQVRDELLSRFGGGKKEADIA